MSQFTTYTADEVVEVEGMLIVDDGVGWADPDSGFNVKGVQPDGTIVFGPISINSINMGGTYRFHSSGAQMLFSNGSVHFLSANIDGWVYVLLCTQAGVEVIGEF